MRDAGRCARSAIRAGPYRFDAPRDGAGYAVTHGNQADHGAFAGVFGDTQIIEARDRDRRKSIVRSTRPLKLVPLDDQGAHARALAHRRLPDDAAAGVFGPSHPYRPALVPRTRGVLR